MEGYHAPTIFAVGNLIAENRMKLGLSMRTCEELGALIKEKTGCNMGLSRKILAEREEPFKSLACNYLGNLEASVLFLLNTFRVKEGSDPPTILLTMDGYKPGNAFRSHTSRRRLAVGLMNGTQASNFLTVCDRRKAAFYEWWVFSLLPAISRMQTCHFQKKECLFRLRVFRIGGDHAELFSLFQGVGGKEYRSAFCATKIDDWLDHMHCCPRLSLQQMHAKGFECLLSARFEEPCFTVTPALHDIKGIIRIILNCLPGACRVEEALLGKTGGNMTGTQSRQLVRNLRSQVQGNKLLLCEAVGLFFFVTRTSRFGFSTLKESKPATRI